MKTNCSKNWSSSLVEQEHTVHKRSRCTERLKYDKLIRDRKQGQQSNSEYIKGTQENDTKLLDFLRWDFK